MAYYVRMLGDKPVSAPFRAGSLPPRSLPCNDPGPFARLDLRRYTVYPDRVEFAVVPLAGAELEAATGRLQRALTVAVQRHLDTTAAARGYGDKRTAPSVSARAYAGYPNPFQAECVAYGQWVAECWVRCYGVLAECQAGERAIPTEAELIGLLPVMAWP